MMLWATIGDICHINQMFRLAVQGQNKYDFLHGKEGNNYLCKVWLNTLLGASSKSIWSHFANEGENDLAENLDEKMMNPVNTIGEMNH